MNLVPPRRRDASYTDEGMKPFVTPRAIETNEVAGIIADYGRATRRAMAAGFDGVELHAASGYLPEQFLSSSTNERSDYLAGLRLSPERGEEFVRAGTADGVVFGAPFFANPDLPERIRRGAPLAEPDRTTFYTPGPKGYVDYPTLAALEAGGTAGVRAEALAS